MATINPLAVLAVAMIGFLLLVTVGILLGRDWNDYEPTLRSEPEDLLTGVLEHPFTWLVGFVLATALLGGTAGYWLVAPEEMKGTIALVVAGVIGLILGFLVFVGVWDSIRVRGRSNSEAVGLGAIVLALLFVLVIAVQLLLA